MTLLIDKPRNADISNSKFERFVMRNDLLEIQPDRLEHPLVNVPSDSPNDPLASEYQFHQEAYEGLGLFDLY